MITPSPTTGSAHSGERDRHEAVASALREHRATHDLSTGAARCECGWEGPFTRTPGRDVADHLAAAVLSALAATLDPGPVVDPTAVGGMVASFDDPAGTVRRPGAGDES